MTSTTSSKNDLLCQHLIYSLGSSLYVAGRGVAEARVADLTFVGNFDKKIKKISHATI